MSRAGASARLFVALELPAALCEELAAWARAAGGTLGKPAPGGRARLRLLASESLHLTVCFLGARPVEEIDALVAALVPCAIDVGELSVGAPVWLPRRRPRALAVLIHDGGGGQLDALHRALAGALSPSGEAVRRRRLRAHVTVARVGAGFRAPVADGLTLAPTPQLRFTPERVVLYRSWLAPAGARYEPVAACRLLPEQL